MDAASLTSARTSHMLNLRRFTWAGVACLTVASVMSATAAQASEKAQSSEKDRPKVSLKATPMMSRAPARVVLTAELTGGADDYEAYYCPTVEWDWGDGTQSESTLDCEPYEPGKSEIKRRFTVVHQFKGGNHKVMFRLKRHDKTLTAATVRIQVQPGLGGIG
jgi:hypothetical protein